MLWLIVEYFFFLTGVLVWMNVLAFVTILGLTRTPKAGELPLARGTISPLPDGTVIQPVGAAD